MTYEAERSGFTSTEQANAIASILEHMSQSDAYDEEDQAIAKALSNTVRRFIKEGIILDQYVTYSRKQERILAEAFEIYVEAKHQ